MRLIVFALRIEQFFRLLLFVELKDADALAAVVEDDPDRLHAHFLRRARALRLRGLGNSSLLLRGGFLLFFRGVLVVVAAGIVLDRFRLLVFFLLVFGLLVVVFF